MTKYPEVQIKAQKELDTVLGKGQLPTFEDLHSLPYLTATIKECLRWEVIVPFAVPHMLTEDDEYKGFFLPRGTLVLANAWSVIFHLPSYKFFNNGLPGRFSTTKQCTPIHPLSIPTAFSRTVRSILRCRIQRLQRSDMDEGYGPSLTYYSDPAN